MAITGKRKAAMLLTTLDAQTARELLSDCNTDQVQELAMEMARIDSSGARGGKETVKIAEQFCLDIEKEKTGGLHVRSFLNEVLADMENKQKNEVSSSLDPLNKKDPFLAICSASSETIAKAIMHERPQIIALVISAIPAKLGTEVMSYIDQETNRKVTCKMALPGDIAPKTRKRIGEMVLRRITEINSIEESSQANMEPTENLRKVAMVLSGLDQDVRDSMLEEVSRKDKDVANTIKALMVTWEDIPRVYDRSLQEALRSIEASTLAKAIFGADEVIAGKIRTNISERAAETLEEEIALMQDPLKKEVLEAREEVVKPLRDANETGQLRFIEG